MFEFHGDVIEVPPTVDVSLVVTRPLRTAAGDVDVRGTLDVLIEEPPGPWMANIGVLLASVAEDDITSDERIDLAVLFDRCEAWMAAQKQRVLAGISRGAGSKQSGGRGGHYEDTALELALALRWSESMVADRLRVASELDERLPETWSALAQGRINFQKAREIALGASKLADDEKARLLERRVLDRVDDMIQTEVRKAVERQVMALDPDGAEERRQSARGRRQVRRSPGEDSCAHLNAVGPTEGIAVIHAALTDGAQQLRATGQVDNLDQGRFDTLTSWAVRHLEEGLLPDRSPVPVGATLVVK